MIDSQRARQDMAVVRNIVQMVRYVDVGNLVDFYKANLSADPAILETVLALEALELKLIAIHFARMSGPIPGQGDTDVERIDPI